MSNTAFQPKNAAEGIASVDDQSVLQAFVTLAGKHGVHLSAAQLCRDYPVDDTGLSNSLIERIATETGLVAKCLVLSWAELQKLGKALPVMLRLRNGDAVILVAISDNNGAPRVTLRDPIGDDDALVVVDEARLTSSWDGGTILIKRRYKPLDEEQPFGMKWVLMQALKERKLFRDIAIASLVLTFFTLVPPMIFMIILDRVLVNHSLSTLNVLLGGVVFLVIFETLFGFMKRAMVAVATARIDGRINLYVYEKLIDLPMDFFERTPTGHVSAKINEIWRIREFLTGQLFGTVLDSLSLLILVPVMLYLNATLGLMVLGLAALICLVVVIFIPPMRRKYGKVVQAQQAQGSHLIESIHGMRTIKSLALEGRKRREWDIRVARAVEARDEFNRFANYPRTITAPLERLIYVGTLGVGAYMALRENSVLYAGTLVAFVMIAQRVAQPLVQIAHLMQNFEEVRGAVAEVGSVMNIEPEKGRSESGVRTPIQGAINFNDVRFRYNGTTVPALDRVSFTIPQGTIFGIMGRSGSGKTTVTRLLQGLHQNYEGLLKIDGIDIREFDLDHVRQNIGVVLQENFLFSGTIRQNIMAARPDATFDQVVRAARLAGAEEFIERLPRGYETVIEEGSANLSGGQRQRIAIARALLIDPPILVLDEATSALDAESEAIVNANLLRIARGRTVIIISHRLSSLVPADNILVLERGSVYDVGRHEDLLRRCDIYKSLWHQQNRHIEQSTQHESPPLPPAAAS